jgi:2-polyprenyl-3-methyl-5-hydroxy-6-metoxy-1,4-benzoquinol methylase
MAAQKPANLKPAPDRAPTSEAHKAVLVVIANYGTKNDRYLRRLLAEYHSMTHRVHVVVLTNVPKSLGEDVEVFVEAPQGEPWSFPFAHKGILAERADDYDLFIYSEDDTLITQRNIDAFLRTTEVLPTNEIAGFLRTEVGPDGGRYFSTVHSHFHWDPVSVCQRGESVFAHFSNEHSACYLLTREQLKHAISSHGFLIGPHDEKYGLLESAATDPYTRCGFRKMICISDLEDFVLPHLPNKYIGRMGLEESELQRQVEALLAISRGERSRTKLLDVETKTWQRRWSKHYYEPCNSVALSLVPDKVRSVLSVGCGHGLTEYALVSRGIRVVALPLDSVIASCAEARGIEIVMEQLNSAPHRLDTHRFDCILLLNILHLLADPVAVVTAFAELLSRDGRMLVGVPNFSYLPYVWRRACRRRDFRELGSYEKTGMHVTTRTVLRQWFEDSGLATERILSVVPERWRRLNEFAGGAAGAVLGTELVAAARRKQ